MCLSVTVSPSANPCPFSPPRQELTTEHQYTHVDFASIDVERHELFVLAGWPARVPVDVITIEINDFSPTLGLNTLWSLLQRGYTVVGDVGDDFQLVRRAAVLPWADRVFPDIRAARHPKHLIDCKGTFPPSICNTVLRGKFDAAPASEAAEVPDFGPQPDHGPSDVDFCREAEARGRDSHKYALEYSQDWFVMSNFFESRGQSFIEVLQPRVRQQPTQASSGGDAPSHTPCTMLWVGLCRGWGCAMGGAVPWVGLCHGWAVPWVGLCHGWGCAVGGAVPWVGLCHGWGCAVGGAVPWVGLCRGWGCAMGGAVPWVGLCRGWGCAMVGAVPWVGLCHGWGCAMGGAVLWVGLCRGWGCAMGGAVPWVGLCHGWGCAMGGAVPWVGLCHGWGCAVGGAVPWVGLCRGWGCAVGGAVPWVGLCLGWGCAVGGAVPWVGLCRGWGCAVGGAVPWVGLCLGWGCAVGGAVPWVGLCRGWGCAVGGAVPWVGLCRGWGCAVGGAVPWVGLCHGWGCAVGGAVPWVALPLPFPWLMTIRLFCLSRSSCIRLHAFQPPVPGGLSPLCQMGPK